MKKKEQKGKEDVVCELISDHGRLDGVFVSSFFRDALGEEKGQCTELWRVASGREG